MNAQKELIKHIGDKDVLYIQITIDKLFRDKEEIIEGKLSDVLPKLNFDYDAGYGRQLLNGTIWYSDGTWSSREEYDGSEWWQYYKCPPLPTKA